MLRYEAEGLAVSKHSKKEEKTQIINYKANANENHDDGCFFFFKYKIFIETYLARQSLRNQTA